MASNQILIQGLIELHLKGEGGQQAVASMTKIVAQAKEVEKATGGLGTGAKKAAEGVGILDKAFGSLGRTVASYFAAGVVANFLRDSFLGFARTERQVNAVQQQLRALGQAVEGAGFDAFIDQLSKTSGILDDDLVPAFQRALATFKSYGAAQEAVTIAAKFAAAGIGDVGSNVDALNRFFLTGSARSLTQFGVNVKAGEESVLDLNEGLKLLYAQLTVTGEGFDDSQRDIENWRRQIDEAGDSIGRATGKLVDLIQRAGTFAGEGIRLALNPDDILKEAQGLQEIVDLQNQLGPGNAAGIAAFKNQSALAEKFGSEQAERDRKRSEDKAKEALKAEKDRLEKAADLETAAEQALLKAKIAAAAEGSDARFALELELNDKIFDAAVANAKKINASVADIEALRILERQRILNQPAADPDAGVLGPGNVAGREKFEAERKAREDHEFELTTIIADAERERRKEARITAELKEDLRRQELQNTLSAYGQAAGALGSLFAKNKGFAIAMAIANTALGITEVWASKAPWYIKLAQTLVVAASGAQQIAAIRSASLSGSGGSPGVGSGGVTASPPTASATPPPGSQVAAQSEAQLSALAGRGAFGGGTTIINIENAFGDKQAMTKLTREINRVNANNQGNLR